MKIEKERENKKRGERADVKSGFGFFEIIPVSTV